MAQICNYNIYIAQWDKLQVVWGYYEGLAEIVFVLLILKHKLGEVKLNVEFVYNFKIKISKLANVKFKVVFCDYDFLVSLK